MKNYFQGDAAENPGLESYPMKTILTYYSY